MKILESQTNFTAGELSPRLWGHVDLVKYKNGLETMLNAYAMPHGPATRRNGTQFINEVKDSSKAVRLIEFQFNQDNAYILEFGHHYIRFYKDKAQLTSGGPAYEVTTTYAESELFELSYIQSGNSLRIDHSNHAPAILSRTSDTSWSLDDEFFYPPITEEAGYAPALSLTMSAATGNGITATASGAVFIAGDKGRQIHHLLGEGIATITSITSTTVAVCNVIEDFDDVTIASGGWKMDLSPVGKVTIDSVTQGDSGSVQSFYTDSARGATKTITGITNANPGVVTSTAHGYSNGDRIEIKGVLGMTQVNNRTWTAKGVTANTFDLANDSNANVDTTNYTAYASGGKARKELTDLPLASFRAADVGKFLLMNNGVGEILSLTSDTEVLIDIEKGMNSAAGTVAWSIETEAWNATNGFPSAVTLHQQRAWHASTLSMPTSVWGSETGIFDAMGVGAEDSDAISVELATKEINKVSWMAGLRGDLIVGTTGAELVISAGNSANAITPTTVSSDVRSYNGSNLQQPVVLNNEVIYIQRSTIKLNSMYYDFASDNYKNDDLLFLAEHLAVEGNGIKEVTFAQDPDRLLYAVCNDGSMLVGTYFREQQIISWGKYVTDGLFESVKTISTGLYDEVWCVVNRTINGSTKRYIEVFDSGTGSDRLDGFSDSYLTYSSPKTITGITKANPGVVTAASHGYSNGDLVKLIDVGGMTEVIGLTFKVAGATLNTFQLTTEAGANVNTTNYTTYTSGGESHKLVTSISGLSHLEGETVQVKIDGATHPDCTVTSGAITLQSRAYEVVVGLPYTTTLTTLRKSYSLAWGLQQGQPTRHIRPVIRLYNSALPSLNGEFLPARDPGDRMDSSVALFTGDATYGPLTWDITGQLTIETSDPLPMTVLGIFGSIEGGTL